MNEDYLKFETDSGSLIFSVYGDCCSTSIFYDFIGVKKLLENGPVKSVKEIDLEIGDKVDHKNDQDCIQAYGFEIVTEHPDFGDQTSVLSFRNYSNGYYGGSMQKEFDDREVLPEIFDDVIETVCSK